MSTATLPASDQQISPRGVVLRDVSWEFYELFLKELGDQRLPHSYVDGELILMSPGVRHESAKEWFTFLIGALTEELELPRRSIGSTTMKLAFAKKGAEPDAGFLIANAPALRGKRDWDIETDPPPDLLVEIDISSRSLNRLPVYAALGVPEVWIYDGENLRVQLLQEDVYHESETSASFPTLPMRQFADWISKAWETDETTWMRNFREWVRENVVR